MQRGKGANAGVVGEQITGLIHGETKMPGSAVPRPSEESGKETFAGHGSEVRG